MQHAVNFLQLQMQLLSHTSPAVTDNARAYERILLDTSVSAVENTCAQVLRRLSAGRSGSSGILRPPAQIMSDPAADASKLPQQL